MEQVVNFWESLWTYDSLQTHQVTDKGYAYLGIARNIVASLTRVLLGNISMNFN